MVKRDFPVNAGAFIATVLFGASVVGVRVAVQDIPPLTLAILRFGQGSFLLLLMLLIWAPDLPRVGLKSSSEKQRAFEKIRVRRRKYGRDLAGMCLSNSSLQAGSINQGGR